MSVSYRWWQSGIVYQIYPRSFMDSNGDGIGDLPGISSRLEYVRQLGVDAIWISPIYPSPMADFGYDVANYTEIHPLFGTLGDFDVLLQKAHRLGLKVILDLVPNHTSDEHPWFVESRANRENPKRDWYIWRDPAVDGGLPNNWQSHFGGDAWTFDAHTGQYYLHLFDTKQPDLNWRNPQVREAIYSAMRFWFERGVDGFRIDVVWLMIKDQELRDEPPNPNWRPGDPTSWKNLRIYSQDQPEVHQVIREMRVLADAFDDRVLIGEIYMPVPSLVTYYGARHDELQLPFNFQLIELTWDAQVIRHAVENYEAALPEGSWPNWVLGNHDRARIATRVGRAQSRVAQMLLLSLRGTPTCYYGDEIGMLNVLIPHDRAVDPQEVLTPGHGRDPERTPMQWDSSPQAGFSATAPWLPVAEDYPQLNVAEELEQPRSMLALFRQLTALRRTHAALAIGAYNTVESDKATVFAYMREADGEHFLIVLNFGEIDQHLELATSARAGEIRCSTLLDRSGRVDLPVLALRGNEGLIIQLS